MINIHQKKKKRISGFTLIEFIVVLTIFSIISSVSIFNYNDYQTRISKSNVAQDIALSVRQAQVYGLAAADRAVAGADFDSTSTASDFFGTVQPDIITDRSIRGLEVDIESNTITLFEDIDRNEKYNSTNDRIIDIRTIGAEKVYLKACVFSDVVPPNPDCTGGQEVIGNPMNITFKRPYPDSTIEFANVQYGSAIIHVLHESNQDEDTYIQIESAGQVLIY